MICASVAEPVALLFQILRHARPFPKFDHHRIDGSKTREQRGSVRIALPSTFASRLSSLGRTRHQGAKATRQ